MSSRQSNDNLNWILNNSEIKIINKKNNETNVKSESKWKRNKWVEILDWKTMQATGNLNNQINDRRQKHKVISLLQRLTDY